MFFSGISDEAGKPIETQIKAHKELGWKYLEIRNVDGENLTLMHDSKFDEVYGKVNDAQMKVSCFAGCIANWSRPITGDFQLDIDELKKAIPRMKKFNTKFIRIMSWPNDKDNPISDVEWEKKAIDRLKELSKTAEDGEIVMVHENCSGWAGESPDNSLKMLSEINSPALKLVFDTGNTVFHGQDAMFFYSKVKEHIVYIHIKDAIILPDGKAQTTYCGEGHAYVPEILQDLKNNDYEGGISIEPHLAAAVHLGKEAKSEEAYKIYVTYGRKLMEIVNNLK